MKLLELDAVLNDLDNLLNLLKTRMVLMFNVWDEELEQVRAHLIVSNCLAGNLLLLNR